jgi:energy-coupling factor transporter ATP-binding protein EcfA2
MMKLLKFRVTNFRSVEDSGWIETDSVTALIGTNESGKTNLLVPLWKLKPANDGEIDPIADYPRKRYNEIRSTQHKPIFIQAFFELADDLATQIAQVTDTSVEKVRTVIVKRDFEGKYFFEFPDASPVPVRHVLKTEVIQVFADAQATINTLSVDETETSTKNNILTVLNTTQTEVHALPDKIKKAAMQKIVAKLKAAGTENISQSSAILPQYEQMINTFDEMITSDSKSYPQENQEAQKILLDHLPSFVYYSTYGNLDSEIYLPHVIDNLKRTDLGSHEQAKARTLKVLFEFVRLNPQEIMELGRDFPLYQGRQPSADEIKVIAKKKKEREILLQSASVELTQSFRSWWKQGDYRFRFQADGDHFRIWVSDDRRPEEIELENRSTGLQWFLSFYLVFLVESTETHKNAILLLDEAGLSLHAIAQQDLSKFFESLSLTNQIIYTTHSPFLVDPDHLDRVKAVYVDAQGATKVSADLRASERNPAQSQSIYPVHAALGLSVSTILLQGCQSIIVEGTSDQFYLSAIKNYLISKGSITPKRELLFVPAGGVKGITAVASILTAKDEALPFAIMDSDRSGRDTANKLKTSLYQKSTDRIIMIGDVCNLADAEVEDLFPHDFLIPIINRYLSRQDIEEFSDEVVENSPIIPQIEAYARKYDIELEDGWKVELAKRVKLRMLKTDPFSSSDAMLKMWQALFTRITSEAPVLAMSSSKA